MTDSENDDIVIRLNLRERGTGSDQDKRGGNEKRRGNRQGRVKRATRGVRRSARRIRSAQAIAKRLSTPRGMLRAGRFGISSLSSVASAMGRATMIGRLGAFANPVGITVAIGAIAALLTYRAMSGRSFDNMIQNIKRKMFGGYDLKAQSAIATQDEILRDPNLLLLANQGTANDQIKYVFDEYRKLRLTYLEGEKLIRTDKDLQTYNKADQLLDNWVDKAYNAWKAANGNELFRWFMSSGL